MRRGSGSQFEGPANDTDLDARNAEIYEAHRGDSAATVRAAARESYAALIDAVLACSDADLLRERPGNGGPVWRVVPGNGHGHVAQHLSYWAAEHGDPAGAEEAAKWGYALDIELFPENQPVADYNFACFYARNGNADEALPLLRAALRVAIRPARLCARGCRHRADPRRPSRGKPARPLSARVTRAGGVTRTRSMNRPCSERPIGPRSS